jgi:hypothetical protein
VPTRRVVCSLTRFSGPVELPHRPLATTIQTARAWSRHRTGPALELGFRDAHHCPIRLQRLGYRSHHPRRWRERRGDWRSRLGARRRRARGRERPLESRWLLGGRRRRASSWRSCGIPRRGRLEHGRVGYRSGHVCRRRIGNDWIEWWLGRRQFGNGRCSPRGRRLRSVRPKRHEWRGRLGRP